MTPQAERKQTDAPDSLTAVHAVFERLLDLPDAEAKNAMAALQISAPRLAAAVERLLVHDARIGDAEPPRATLHLTELLEELGGPAVEPGREIGAWRIESEIGQGGMGRVYRAVRGDGAFEREAAIKLIRRDLVSAESMQRFAAEKRILATLDHPGIVRLLDAGEIAEGSPFVVMEFVRGEAITAWCDRHAFGPRARVQLFRQVLDAVAHAHRRLIVHRDLKPDNILVDEGGQVRLLDFGIAKALEGGLDGFQTVTGDRHFTPAYAAPEQLQGHAITVGCDLYALGLVLYELLAGCQPFAGTRVTAAEMERRILLQPPRELSQSIVENDTAAHGFDHPRAWRRALRGDLDAIVQRALRKEVDTRYGSADEFAADIDEWLAGRPLPTRRSQRLYRARKFVARNRAGVAVLSLAMLLLFAFTAVVLRQNQALSEERDRTALERDRARQSIAVLQEAFEAADPSRTGGENVTARSVLEAARARLPTTARGNPQLALELAATIATVQIDLGLAGDALKTVALADRIIARAPRQSTIRVEHELLRLRAQLGAGDFDGSERTIALAKRLARAEDKPALHMALGRLLAQRSQLASAIGELEQAVAAYAGNPALRREWVEANWHLAGALDLNDDRHQSLAVLERTLAVLQRELGSRHPHTIATQLRRAGALRSLGFGGEALDEVRTAATATERIYGKQSTASATARISLGNLYTEGRDYAAAAREFRAAITAWPASAGAEDPNLFRARFNLAQVLGEIPAHFVESEAMYNELLPIAVRSFGAQHRTIYLLRAGHADLLNRQSRHAAALEVLLPDGADSVKAGWRDGAQKRFLGDLRAAANGAACIDDAPVPLANPVPAGVTASPSAQAGGIEAPDLARLCTRARNLLAEPRHG